MHIHRITNRNSTMPQIRNQWICQKNHQERRNSMLLHNHATLLIYMYIFIYIYIHNHTLLKQNKTTTLYYTKDYSTMQTNLEKALEEINKYILETNRFHRMSTPYCHTAAIRKHQGKPARYYYKFCYDLLWDGVHGTTQTRDKWGKAIEGAMRNNRGHTKKQKQPASDRNQVTKAVVEGGKVDGPIGFNQSTPFVHMKSSLKWS